MTTKTNIEAVNSGQTEREALLPCPFCGDKAEYKHNSLHGDESMAVCRCCGAQAFWSKWQARALLAAQSHAPASPSGEDAAEQSAAPMAGPKMPNGFQISCDPLSAVEACINDYEQEKETPVSNAILSGLYKARQVLTLPRASEKADEAVTDGVAHFNWLCSLMPEGFHWGEPLTPDVLDHIAIAARAKDSK